MGIATLDGLGGVGGGSHARSEWVDLAHLPARAALLAGLVDAVLQQPRPRTPRTLSTGAAAH
ncbi:hypothetical protein ACFQZ4_36820 [Catellatospora coxensis]